MKIEKIHTDRFLLEISREELRIMKDCILNLDNMTGDGELNTLTGATRQQVATILEDLVRALRTSS